MDTMTNAILGLVFLGLSWAGTILMFKLWGYPFDHEKMQSSAPRSLMFIHRAIGYVYLAIYIYLMIQMVPRLWTYQVELPARTVAHLTLGISIGVILITKVLIVRFFKYLESQMAPILGTALLIATTLLIGLSVPLALRESYLSKSQAGGTVYSEENLERVKMLLPKAGFDESAPMEEISTVSGLKQGRKVLLGKCVQCHDLRTILVRPKTPDKWVQTVSRMSERSLLAEPIAQWEQWYVSAYLIAISPQLQESVKEIREQEIKREQSRAAVETVSMTIKSEKPAIEELGEDTQLAQAQALYEETCSQCHSLSNVESDPPTNAEEAADLVDRMFDNGLDITDEDFEKIVFYLTKTYGQN